MRIEKLNLSKKWGVGKRENMERVNPTKTYFKKHNVKF
jgi:hypothetical protein